MPGLDSMRRRLSSIAKPTPEPSPTPPSHTQPDPRLLNPDYFNISDDDRTWFHKVNLAVRHEMTKLTTSHDYMHIQRVTVCAYSLYLDERHLPWTRDIDPRTIVIAALVHSVGGLKYLEDASENEKDFGHRRPNSPESVQNIQHDLVFEFLRRLDCPPDVAGPAALMASLVSFKREMGDREKVQDHCEAYPALRFVQDAERLDGLGFVGIARLGMFEGGGGKGKGERTILEMVRLVDERFVHYVGLMKTKTGRKEAERRWGQMLEFRDGLVSQTNCAVGLECD